MHMTKSELVNRVWSSTRWVSDDRRSLSGPRPPTPPAPHKHVSRRRRWRQLSRRDIYC